MLSPKQAAAVADLANRCSLVRVEDRGAGYLGVTMFDVEGKALDTRRVDPGGFFGTKDLPDQV